MHDLDDATCRRHHGFLVPDVTLQKLDSRIRGVRADRLEVFPTSRHEIVEDSNVAALSRQTLRYMRADEAGPTRHKHAIVLAHIILTIERA